MRRFLTTILLAAGLAGPTMALASATTSPLDRAFGKTVVSTYPDGRRAELYLHRDGTYTATGRRGDHSSGTWDLKGAKVCLKQRRPFAAPFAFCTPVPTGSTWTAKAVTGETVQVSIVAGAG